MRWIHTPLPAAEVREVCRRLAISPVLAELLLRSGLKETAAAAQFLHPALADLHDPFLLVNLDAAVARLRRAIERRETLVVLGDYDVDGVSSTALLVSVLRRFGLDPRFVVPRRLEEGYGLSRGARSTARWRPGKPRPVHRARLRHQFARRARLPAGAGSGRHRHRPPPVEGEAARGRNPDQSSRQPRARRRRRGATFARWDWCSSWCTACSSSCGPRTTPSHSGSS